MLEALSDSLGAIPHDDLGRWRSGKLALAAATTHTTVESHDQAQPCASADGKLAAVFDGYLLNHAEIASELEARGAKLRNRSDVEIALAGYETWGEGVAEKLRGEYSLIIADLRANRLFITRDHMGFVPLYYKEEPGRLIIASDLRTIYALSSTPLEPNKRFLAQMLANRYYLREDTVWSGVKKFIRAHTYSFDGEQMRSSRYWVPDTKISIRYSSEREYVEHYKEVLFDCVRRASRADRPVGIAVSGGLDSSSIFCIADILEKRGELQAPGFAGYSLAAEQGSNAYELPYARAVAEHVGRPLTEVPLFDPNIDWYIEDARWHRDISMGSNGAMMLGMDRRAVADGSRVMINGSGGDEWLQGNTQYYREYIAERDFGAFGKALARDAESMGWVKAFKQAGRQTVAELTPGAIRSRIQERLRQQRRSGAFSWLAEEMRDILAQAEEDYVTLLPENGVHLAKHNLVMSPFHDKVYGLMRRQRAKAGLQSRHPMLSRAFIDFSLHACRDQA